MSNPERAESPNRRNWLQVSLRSILFLMLLVATYIAGWLSHKQFNNHNLDMSIASAVERIKKKQLEVEYDELYGVKISSRTNQDVSDVITAIKQVRDAVRK